MNQARWAFPCPSWGQSQWWQADPYGKGIQSPACQYHGCSFDRTAKTCGTINTSGTITTEYLETTYSQTVEFINPSVQTNSLTFSVQVKVAVVQNANAPQWPILQILSPRAGLQTWSNQTNATCSSYDSQGAAGPVPFIGQPYSSAYLTANFSNFQFTEPGLHQFFGYAHVGSQFLVRSAVTDGSFITYTLTMDLSKIILECAARGASVSEAQNGRVYSIPISYIERGIGNTFLQTTRVFELFIQTTGQVSIASAAPYHQRAFPVELVYLPCSGTNRARQRITWQLFVEDQFSATQLAGPRSISDVIIPPNSNCYGDSVTAFEALGCSTLTSTCSYQFVTESRCRTRSSDAQTFSVCSNADAADRISDLGSDIPYNVALDGVHLVHVNTYTCPINNTVSCTLTNSNPDNNADVLTARIASSDPQDFSANVNPFQITFGVLPTPDSIATDYIPLGGTVSNTTVRLFDGNVFNNEPLNVLMLAPVQTQNDVDLRLDIFPGNITIYALDVLAQRLPGVAPLDWRDIAASTIYTTKNAFDDGCGAEGTCLKMPACSSILGCDGFSVPSAVLQERMPANGYEFELAYRIGLPNPDGSPPNARRLLALTTVSDASFIGRAVLRFSITINSTDTGSGSGSSTGAGGPTTVTVEIDLGIQGGSTRHALTHALVPTWIVTAAAYVFCSAAARFTNIWNK